MTINEASTLIHEAFTDVSEPVIWADLGCGDGLFTRALASLLPAGGMIYAIDSQKQRIVSTTGVSITFIQTDFEKNDLPFKKLDGILMANALHYVNHQAAFIQKIKSKLSANGRFIIVEYEMTTPNPWVPYPVPFAIMHRLFSSAGFNKIIKLGDTPSKYRSGTIYAAVISP